MAPRFSSIRFNLLKAIELFGDLNHEDMDVIAPPSGENFFKEHQLAERLNECLSQLIEDGFFDDCDLRAGYDSDDSYDYEDDDDGDYEEEEEGPYNEDSDSAEDGYNRFRYDSDSRSTPRSSGFEFEASVADPSAATGSRESFSHRFKRYLSRIIPGRRSNRGSRAPEQPSHDDESSDDDDDDNVDSNGTSHDLQRYSDGHSKQLPMEDEQDSDAMLEYAERREPSSLGHDELDEAPPARSRSGSRGSSGGSSLGVHGRPRSGSRSRSRAGSPSRPDSRGSRRSSGSARASRSRSR